MWQSFNKKALKQPYATAHCKEGRRELGYVHALTPKLLLLDWVLSAILLPQEGQKMDFAGRHTHTHKQWAVIRAGFIHSRSWTSHTQGSGGTRNPSVGYARTRKEIRFNNTHLSLVDFRHVFFGKPRNQNRKSGQRKT